MEKRRESLAVVRAIAGLGRSLGIRTTAEGIETAGQLAIAEEEGCSDGQGDFLGPPIDERVDEFLRSPLGWQTAADG